MKRLLFLGVLLVVFYCKAQQVFPLNTFTENVVPNGYVKDINNELDPFVGIYKTNFQDNEIILHISKMEYKLEKRAKKTYYSDVLIIKYIIKNAAGTILQSTQNDSEIRLYSNKVFQNTAIFYYMGTNCNVGNGKIYLKKTNTTELLWDYRPNSMILDQQNCPGNQDTKVYLPVTKDLIFTKQ
ncbi:MAG: hypothetical protein LBE92_10970 [Chryseobacterium sp.]|uniref:DUF6705 family protein n=1 Tax=Chryseobacterium sp. TaxID=1871047 RepID=UPI0028281CA5|nr:DUF6705 family protein [Chryseobacterium sp.]MDR2236636.1 hypothetical protein [Chryseobacterium sp.]